MVDCSEKPRSLRKARNLTQSQVAESVGISKAMVSAYETAGKAPSIDVLIRLSRLYGARVDYLVCVDAPKYIDVSELNDESATLVAALAGQLNPQK